LPLSNSKLRRIRRRLSWHPGKRNRLTVFRNGKLAHFTFDLPLTEISGKDESGKQFKYVLFEGLECRNGRFSGKEASFC
jgi:hypothetical protein